MRVALRHTVWLPGLALTLAAAAALDHFDGDMAVCVVLWSDTSGLRLKPSARPRRFVRGRLELHNMRYLMVDGERVVGELGRPHC